MLLNRVGIFLRRKLHTIRQTVALPDWKRAPLASLQPLRKNSSENSYCVLPREGRVAGCRLCAKRMMDGTQRLRRRRIPSTDCSCPRRLSRVLRGAWRLHADLFIAYLWVPWPLLAYCNIYCLPQTKRSKEVNGQCSRASRVGQYLNRLR